MDSYEIMQSRMLNKTITLKRFQAYLQTLNIQSILCIIYNRFGDTVHYKDKPYFSIICDMGVYSLQNDCQKMFSKSKYVTVLSQLSNGSDTYNYYNMLHRHMEHGLAPRELTPYEQSMIRQLMLAERVNVLLRFKRRRVVQRDVDALFETLDPLIISCITENLENHDMQNLIAASTQYTVRKMLNDAKKQNELNPSEMNTSILEKIKNNPVLLTQEFGNILVDMCENMALDESKTIYLFYTDEKNSYHEKQQEGIPTGELQYIEPDASNVIKIHNARKYMQQRGWDGIIRKLTIEYKKARDTAVCAWHPTYFGSNNNVLRLTTFVGKGDVQKLRKSVHINGIKINQQDQHHHWSLAPWTQALAQRTNIIVNDIQIR